MLNTIEDITVKEVDPTGLGLFACEDNSPFATVDIYGEQNILPQVILYTEEDVSDYIAVRYDENGKIEEIFIPEFLQERIVGDELTPWLKRRDGK